MADFAKINFQIDEDISLKKKMMQELMQDPYIQQMAFREHMREEDILKNVWKIKKWREQIEPCLACQGLSMCKQPSKGYVQELTFDVFLQTSLKACKYQQTYLKQRKHLTNILYNDMPEDMYTVFFENVDLSLPTNNSLEYAEVFNKVYDCAYNEESLYLHGQMGTGKTYLACCAVNHFAEKGKTAAFVVWSDLISKLVMQIGDASYKNTVNMLCYVDFLVIDDIGSEKVTEWNRDEILFNILNRRMNAKKCTWLTSNLDLETLEKHFQMTGIKEEELKAKRIIERIRASAKVQALTGKDRRIHD